MEVYGMKIRLTFLICFIDFWYNVSFFDLLTFPDEITKPKLGQKKTFDIYKAVPQKTKMATSIPVNGTTFKDIKGRQLDINSFNHQHKGPKYWAMEQGVTELYTLYTFYLSMLTNLLGLRWGSMSTVDPNKSH